MTLIVKKKTVYYQKNRFKDTIATSGTEVPRYRVVPQNLC